LFFSRASSVAYANGARVCFNKLLSGAFLANANSAPAELLIAAERNRESEV